MAGLAYVGSTVAGYLDRTGGTDVHHDHRLATANAVGHPAAAAGLHVRKTLRPPQAPGVRSKELFDDGFRCRCHDRHHA